MPSGWKLRSDDGQLLDRVCTGRYELQRRKFLHDGRCVYERSVRWDLGDLQRKRRLSRRGPLQSDDGSLLQPRRTGWHCVQRAQRVHDR